MKKIASIAVLSLVLSFSACSSSMQNIDDTPEILSSIAPIHGITRAIIGESLQSDVIVPTNISGHTWQPKPRDSERIENAKFIIVNGGGVDTFVEQIAERRASDKTLVLFDEIHSEEHGEEDHEEDNHDEAEEAEHQEEESHKDEDHKDEDNDIHYGHSHDEGENPHLWLNAEEVQVYAQSISEHLQELYPSRADEFSRNTKNFIEKVEKQHQDHAKRMNTLTVAPFLDFHGAYEPFYEMHPALEAMHKGSIEPYPGKEPTPKYIEELEKRITEDNITVLFVEPHFEAAYLNTLLDRYDVEVYTLDPLGTDMSTEGYFTLMENIAQSFEKAFQ